MYSKNTIPAALPTVYGTLVYSYERQTERLVQTREF